MSQLMSPAYHALLGQSGPRLPQALLGHSLRPISLVLFHTHTHDRTVEPFWGGAVTIRTLLGRMGLGWPLLRRALL